MERHILNALFDLLVVALGLRLSERARSALGGALHVLAAELERPCPMPSREERRAARAASLT